LENGELGRIFRPMRERERVTESWKKVQNGEVYYKNNNSSNNNVFET